MVSTNKKCKTKENPNGAIKNWKLKKVKTKMGKLDKKWLSQQQIRNAIGNASAAPYKHSTT